MSDSRPDTYEHIHWVQIFMNRVIQDLMGRSLRHDRSKLTSPEKEAFDKLDETKREGIVYGTPEYKAMFDGIKPEIQRHYQHNSHHPEHWANGIYGMSLLDLLEMLCDWKAASRRHDGSVRATMDKNQERFGFSDEVKGILLNTLKLIEPELIGEPDSPEEFVATTDEVKINA